MSSNFKNMSDVKITELEEQALKSLESNFESKKNMKLKIAIIAAFCLTVASFAASIYLYREFHQEKRQRAVSEASLQQLRDKTAAYEQSIKQKDKELSDQKKELEDYSGLKKEFETNLRAIQKKNSELQSKLEEAEKTLALDAMKKAAHKEQADFDLQPVGPPLPGGENAAAGEVAETQGPQVMTVNTKYNFIVVNLGLHDQIKLGDTLKISRNGKQIGKANVEKIYDNFAAAAIVQGSQEIKEGDSAAKA